MKITDQRQEPYVYGSLGGQTVALVAAPQTAVRPASSSVDVNVESRRDYENAERVGTKDAWDAFLNLHASGFYADLARAQRAKALNETTQRSPSTAPASTAAPAVAAISPAAPPAPTAVAAPAPGDVTRLLQTELVRVGCYSGAINGEWNTASRRALGAFNQNASTKLDAKSASMDALNAVREKQARVCPLVCDKGSRAEGDTCVRIACETGYAPDDKGNCAPVRNQPQQTTTRSRSNNSNTSSNSKRQQQPSRADAGNKGGQSQACDRFGCHPVGKGCHVETSMFREETQQTVVCR
jgi:hypothetical protein